MMRCWSFSSMNTYTTCPKQYELTYVQNVIKYQETEATRWGSEVHKALEDYVNGVGVLGDKFKPYAKFADKILSLPGERFVEKQFALTRNLEPTEFDSMTAWCRGIIDVGVINGYKALVGDYKTGKIRHDSDQLKLFAGFIMRHYPQVQSVKTAYIWLAHDKTTVERYTRDDLPSIWEHFITKAARLEASYAQNRWLKNPSGLCRGWCGAGRANCEYWSPKRC